MSPTMKEIQAMADAEEKQALTQAIDTFITTTRVGRAAKASTEALDNRKQAKAGEWAKASGHREVVVGAVVGVEVRNVVEEHKYLKLSVICTEIDVS